MSTTVWRFAIRLVVALWMALGGAAAWAVTCSPYMGQVVINEVRVGATGKAAAKNQIELFNVGNVPQAVWQTWSYQVWLKDGTTSPVRKGTYRLNAGHAVNGAFIYGTTAKVWLQNQNNRAVDIALYDGNGALVAYFAIEGQAQAVPACHGPVTVVQASSNKKDNGSIRRATDGGAWPAALTQTGVHTIGRTNVCSTGADLVVTHDVDYAKPVRNTTTVAFTVTVFNNACTTNVAGVEVTVTNLTTAALSGRAVAVSAGSATGTGTITWNVGTVNAGVARTLTVTGKPTALGTLTSTATVTKPTTGLVNTGDDSDSASITVYDFNYVALSLERDQATEGTDLRFAVKVVANVPVAANTTVAYTVGGTAGAGDHDLGSGGTVVIAKDDDTATIEFSITDDTLWEPTKTIVITITAVATTDAKVRLGSAATGDVLSEEITLYDDDPLQVHHYELVVPSTAVSCTEVPVAVHACADASSPCTNRFTGLAGKTATLAASAGSLGATTLTFDADGVAATTLAHPGAADGASVTLTLGGEQVAAGSPRRCCPDGVACVQASQCSVTLRTAGFVIAAAPGGAATTVPTQTAGTTSAGHVLRALRSDGATKACTAALSGATTVDWSYTCHDPATCSAGARMTITGAAATAVAGNPHPGGAASTPVAMHFDADGNAPFTLRYADVGRVSLRASKAAGGALKAPLAGASNAFVVRPAGFVLSDIRCATYAPGSCATTAIPAPGLNPGAASAAGTPFLPAGAPFAATVTAVDAAGQPTPNYGREAQAEGVRLDLALVAPAGGHAPPLGNATGFGAFAGGTASGSAFTWPEVGIVALTPRVADGDYLGAGDVVGTPASPVGRFVPARLAAAGTAVTHRALQGCTPASTFTYLGEPFRLGVTLTAQTTTGATTRNYGGAFARFDPAAAAGWNLAGVAGSTVFSPASGRLAVLGATGAWVDGVASATLTAAALRGAATDGPFNATFGIAPVDADGVALAAHDLDTDVPPDGNERTAVGTLDLRFGRLRLTSAIGAADRALALPAAAQHWTGSAFADNALDSCTTVPTTAVNFGNWRQTLTAADTVATGPIVIRHGRGVLPLAAPGGGRSGSVDVALSLGPGPLDASCLQPWVPGGGSAAAAGAGLAYLRFAWCGTAHDRDPAARATLGRQRGHDALVHRQENY